MNKAVHTGARGYLFTSLFVDWKYGEDKTKTKQTKTTWRRAFANIWFMEKMCNMECQLFWRSFSFWHSPFKGAPKIPSIICGMHVCLFVIAAPSGSFSAEWSVSKGALPMTIFKHPLSPSHYSTLLSMSRKNHWAEKDWRYLVSRSLNSQSMKVHLHCMT